MTVHSLQDALQDTATLDDVARKAGITLAQARLVMAAIHDLPVLQVMRMGATSKAAQIRQLNRETRTR